MVSTVNWLAKFWSDGSALLAIVALLADQSSAWTFIHNAILFIDTSNNASYNQLHWLVGTPYLSTIASNAHGHIKPMKVQVELRTSLSRIEL